MTTHAQSTSSQARSGSFYTNFGVGFPQDIGHSTADGMGILGVSYVESYVPGVGNPAHWGSTILGMATGGINLQNFSASDNISSSRNTLLNTDYFQIQLPIYQNKLGISASLRPYTRSAYNRVENGMLPIGSGVTSDTLQYQIQNNGDGGINVLELGAGWRINSTISVGYAASLFLTSIDNEFEILFENPGYQTVNFNNKTSGFGFGNRFGVQLDFPRLFNENDRLSAGAAINLPVTISAEREQRSQAQTGNSLQTIVIDDEGNLGDGDIQLPFSLQGGVTYNIIDVVSVSAEGQYEQWSDFSSDFDDNANLLTDRYKTGIGIRYRPFVRNYDTFLSQFKYTAGISYDTGHLELNNRKIETMMFSFGLGIFSPGANSNSSVDISVQYGIRGTEAQNLVKENIWGLKLSLNLAELMFNRPKLR